MVLGTPGSGKSYAIINQYIKQTIEKGYSLFLYDFKYPDLSEIATTTCSPIWTATRSSPSST